MRFFLIYVFFGLFFVATVAKEEKTYQVYDLPPVESPYPTFIRMLGENMHVKTKAYAAYLQFTVNVNTPAYKRYKITQVREGNTIKGVQYMDWRKEIPKHSERKLDLFLSGKRNFFTVMFPNGEVAYTHDGRLVRESDGLLTVVSSTYPILGQQGKIYLSNADPEISEEGHIYDDGVYIDTLKITTFDSNDGLFTYDGMYFYIKDPTKSKVVENGIMFVKQGFFEASNEYPGMQSSKVILPYLEGTIKATKFIFQSYDHMFRAAGPD